MIKRVIILLGPPGVGKSSMTKLLTSEAELDGKYVGVVSADNFFMKDGVYTWVQELAGIAHQRCFENFVWMLDNRVDLIIVDNTNAYLQDLKKYSNEALSFGYSYRILPVNPHLWDKLELLETLQIHKVPMTSIASIANAATIRLDDIDENGQLKPELIKPPYSSLLTGF